jgi:soluble lytic murein transglycosylase-like protein
MANPFDQFDEQKPSLIDSALKAEGVSGKLEQVVKSVFQQESGSGKNSKTSNAGAVGGMQIIPATFKSVADDGWDINNPEHNIRAGIRYLKQLDKQSGGDPALTAAGYYGGPGGMEKARQGIAVSDPRNPKAPNTLQYGQQVAARIQAQPSI